MILNFDTYKDQVRACWIGKNIGGTMGGPFECRKEILDVTGFTSAPGEPLPNDDLDLQLLWKGRPGNLFLWNRWDRRESTPPPWASSG